MNISIQTVLITTLVKVDLNVCLFFLNCAYSRVEIFFSLQSGRIMITAPPSTFPAPTASPMSWTTWLRTFRCLWWLTKISKSENTPNGRWFVFFLSVSLHRLAFICTRLTYLLPMYLKAFCCTRGAPSQRVKWALKGQGLLGYSQL